MAFNILRDDESERSKIECAASRADGLCNKHGRARLLLLSSARGQDRSLYSPVGFGQGIRFASLLSGTRMRRFHLEK